jgi:hypothetical protein
MAKGRTSASKWNDAKKIRAFQNGRRLHVSRTEGCAWEYLHRQFTHAKIAVDPFGGDIV